MEFGEPREDVMLSRLEINGYRSFSSMVLDPLCRVSLIVGQNDAGKTTVLEAVDLLVRSHDSRAVEAILTDRQEVRTSVNGVASVELDFAGLFHGRIPSPGGFSITGSLGDAQVSFRLASTWPATRAAPPGTPVFAMSTRDSSSYGAKASERSGGCPPPVPARRREYSAVWGKVCWQFLGEFRARSLVLVMGGCSGWGRLACPWMPCSTFGTA